MYKESELEAFLSSYVKGLGGLTYKFTGPIKGLPDRVVLYKGLTVFVELKTDKGTLSPAQEFRCNQISEQLVPVYVLYGIKGIDLFLSNLKRGVHPRGVVCLPEKGS